MALLRRLQNAGAEERIWPTYPGNLQQQDFHSPRVWSYIGFTYPMLWHFARMPAFTIPLFDLDDGVSYRC